MKKRYFKLAAFALTAILTVGLSGCGSNKSAGDNTNSDKQVKSESKLDEIKKKGKIVLGTSPDYPPYEFIKEENGKQTVVGFDIEIAKLIAKDLGVELEIKEMDFKGLLSALQAGSIDMVLAGMTPNEDRKKSVDFSNVYYTAVQKVVVRAEDKDKIKSIDDLKGKKVGVQKGAIQEEIAAKQMPNSEAKALSKISDITLALKTKKIDAAIIEEPVAKSNVSANSDLAISDINLKTEEAGSAVAFKKGNKELVDEVNKTIEKLIQDKTIDKLVTEATNLFESK
ncbi:amino acid ABC transporter substrate-binding protein, PAAT family [Clostridium sp. USBA 49]|jgi:polar amino acid transport system substrate-binding protein|uniref:transporter substrate-binding domain-containing protein n=1 Tax=Clostridium sp. USBA 49 TaxID=1881060 RepID=UPI000999469E|nr:transporter substrate-binding domain-containing protein [Clostridium sp. USBA 49]SKA85910.1 amino acid ABC transporter substrate-binding protein, PAAT family [Clostridium sp. USBA 49]